MKVDVLVIGDFRFPGGTSTAIASDVRALAAQGYSVGLLALATGPLSTNRAMHPEIWQLAEQNLAQFVAQREHVDARLCCLHHPSVFETYPAVAPDVTCDNTMLIVHHPPVDNDGELQFQYQQVDEITQELFGPVLWAPVGSKVRQAFAGLAKCPPLAPTDWHNIIDADEYGTVRKSLIGTCPVLGRHSRPQMVKWPDDRKSFLDAYPDDPTIKVRLMGYGPDLDDIVEDHPANWETLDFNALPVRDFLGTLDFFSYFHSDAWIEAFGRSILEAMSAGLVCFLPRHFEDLFEDGAIYCDAKEVAGLVHQYEQDLPAYAAQSQRAVMLVKDKFGPDKVVSRVRNIIGSPEPANIPGTVRKRATLLYLTSNGIGMGHLTRCMATARRLSPDIKPVIVTMSKAFAVVRDQGITVEFLPFYKGIGISREAWTRKLENEVTEILRFHQPEVFVFDANVSYEGVVGAMDRFPHMWKIWQRRALWRPEAGRDSLEREGAFDIVLEPGELVDPVDRGLTKPRQRQALCVPGIRYLDTAEILPRKAARHLLGLAPDQPALLLQMGSGNNFESKELIEIVFDLADKHRGSADLKLVFATWRNSHKNFKLPAHVMRLEAYPITQYLKAFDGAVAMAGYNTFHENIAAGLPTLFVSNEHPQQDEQWLRADFGALRGLCLKSRPDNPYQFRRQLDQLLRPQVQQRLRSACVKLDLQNGAAEAARFIEQLALSRKPHTVQRRAG